MMSVVVVVSVLLSVNLDGSPQADPASAELASIQGTWKLIKWDVPLPVEVNARAAVAEFMREARIVVKGHQATLIWDRDPVFEFTVSFAPAAANLPKAVDLRVDACHESFPDSRQKNGRVFRGIYKLEQEQLRFLAGEIGDTDRPKGFPREPGKGIWTFERVWGRQRNETEQVR